MLDGYRYGIDLGSSNLYEEIAVQVINGTVR